MTEPEYCHLVPSVQCQASVVLRAVTTTAECFLQTMSLEKSIRQVSEQLGRATAVSRVSIFENQPDGGGHLYTGLHYEWTAAGIRGRTDDVELDNLSFEAYGLSRWSKVFSDGQVIYGAVREFPAQERSFLDAQGIRSVLMVPVFVGSEWWGFITLEDCRRARPWSQIEIDAVRAVAGMLGALIGRRRAEESERKLMQMKDDFIASLSHELRTPLYAITGFVELLQKNKVKDAVLQAEFMARIVQNADRLVALVDELLDASRLETGRVQLDLTEVDVPQLIGETLDCLESLAAKKGIDLQKVMVGADGLAPASVIADPHRLKQVLVNLVGNAIKFSRANDKVVVRVVAEAEQIRVEVIDHGPGIPEDDQALVFTKFYRTVHSVNNAVAGTGLGLYISKMILDGHGGSIGVKSSPGVGSTFYFTLPTALAQSRRGSGRPEVLDKGEHGCGQQNFDC